MANAGKQGDPILLEAHAGAPAVAEPPPSCSAAMSSTVTGSPAGTPSTVATRAWPWDSPAVGNRSTIPTYPSTWAPAVLPARPFQLARRVAPHPQPGTAPARQGSAMAPRGSAMARKRKR